MDTILSFRAASRDFYTCGRVVHAVAEVRLDVAPGEFLTVVGPSGCGKSTLLNMILMVAVMLFNALLNRLERYVLRWRPRERAGQARAAVGGVEGRRGYAGAARALGGIEGRRGYAEAARALDSPRFVKREFSPHGASDRTASRLGAWQ